MQDNRNLSRKEEGCDGSTGSKLPESVLTASMFVSRPLGVIPKQIGAIVRV